MARNTILSAYTKWEKVTAQKRCCRWKQRRKEKPKNMETMAGTKY